MLGLYLRATKRVKVTADQEDNVLPCQPCSQTEPWLLRSNGDELVGEFKTCLVSFQS